MEDSNIYETLIELGYRPSQMETNHYRCKPLYRESANSTSLRINKNTGRCIDFSSGESFDIEALVAKTLNIPYDKAKDWCGKQVVTKQPPAPIMSVSPRYPLSATQRLLKKYDFYIERGISKETLRKFECGLATSNKMEGRFVFPIFSPCKNHISGFSGRDVSSKKKVKWKHLGNKQEWLYPYFLNKEDIREKNEVIIVESIGDMLALYESGVKNVLVSFGISLGREVFKKIISSEVKVCISLNNEPLAKKGGGGCGALKIKQQLEPFLPDDKVYIKPPTLNDFGLMKTQDIVLWNKNRQH